MSLSTRSAIWTEEQRDAHRATGRVGHTKRHRVWTEERRDAHRNRRRCQHRPKVDEVEVDTCNPADLWRRLAGGNDDALAIIGVVLDLARLRHLDCPTPPVRRGSTTHTWHIHAADLIAPGVRPPGWKQPRFTARQIEAACLARTAVEQFVVMATVDTPTNSET